VRQQGPVNKELPHPFQSRKHGSKLACQWCGATEGDPIHPKLPKPRRGQALVEMALATPILLLLLLGILWLGMLMTWNLRLEHAAIEGAVAGASNPGDSCGVAIVAARKVYGLPLDEEVCAVQGGFLTLILTDTLTFPTPWGTEWRLSSTQQAVLR
jgi:hypothetical protein